MWIKTGMVRSSSQTLLLIERSDSDSSQNTNWGIGYTVENPAQQQWDDANPSYPLPLLHTLKTRAGTQIRFNYLFCDNHVDLLSPSQTVHDKTRLVPDSGGNFDGGDFMWTIDPVNYKDS